MRGRRGRGADRKIGVIGRHDYPTAMCPASDSPSCADDDIGEGDNNVHLWSRDSSVIILAIATMR